MVEPLQAQLDPLREQIDSALDEATPAPGRSAWWSDRRPPRPDRRLRDEFEDEFEALLTPEQLEKWQALQAVCRAADVTTGA